VTGASRKLLAMIFVMTTIGSVDAQHRRQTDTGTLVPGYHPAAPIGSSGFSGRPIVADELQPIPNAQALLSARRVVTCVVNSSPAKVRTYLLSAPDQHKFALLGNGMSTCLGSVSDDGRETQMNTGGSMMHRLFAEGYLRKHEMKELSAISLDKLLQDPRFKSGPAGADKLSQCLVYTQPALSRNLVVSSPGSDGEATAVGAIAPFISGCLDKGVTMTINRDGLRLHLADALFYRLNDKNDGGSGVGSPLTGN